MVKRQLVSYSYTCDVCGGTISDGENANRKVSWEGTEYVVDVCSAHGSELEDLLTQLQSFVDAGTRVSARRGRRPGTAPTSASKAPRGSRGAAGGSGKRGDLSAVRAWARENGMKVSERGRIPGDLLAAYEAAQGGSTSPAPKESSGETSATVTAAATRAPRSRRTTASTSKSGSSPKRGDLGAVRAWARENGMKVSERGRIPGELLSAYDAANNGGTPKASSPRGRRPRKATAVAS
jgi:hypothetical protein